MRKARIIATSAYAPDNVVTNADLEQLVNTTDEWITERTGIKERHIAKDGQAASDLAYEAALRALREAGLSPNDIDLILVATVTADMTFPSTACIVQSMLGARHAVAFDLNAACSGFLFGLSVANSFILSGQFRRVLVIGAEVLSRFTDWEDRTTCVLFGDGAGAVILEGTSGNHGILSCDIHSDGSYGDLLYVPAGGSRQPPTKETVKKRLHYIKMKGNETFKIAVRTLENVAVETLKKNGIEASQLALMIPHQANLRIIQATANRLGLPMDKVIVNLARYGNTSAASIPIALDEAVKTGRVHEGDYILLEAFGGGLTWASALIRW
jgi:3-oxoacyl-[acyl-carrier-protein] synthase-3